jgi:membrane-associated phospholipid phosphatase
MTSDAVDHVVRDEQGGGRVQESARRRRLFISAYVGGGLIAASLLVMPFDRDVSNAIARFAEDGTWLHRVVKLPYHFFSRWGFVLVPLALLALRNRWRLLVGFGVTMAAGATVHLLKFLVGRARPGQGAGPFDFHPLGDPRHQLDSFPSAHAVYATLLAALLGIYFPRWRPVLILFVIMVCLARVVQERHFASDVLAGAGFGLLVVHIVVRGLGQAYFDATKAW